MFFIMRLDKLYVKN